MAIKVTYAVKRGTKVCRETEEYPNIESTTRGIQDRISDPFSPKVEDVVEVTDRKGRTYDIEWSCMLMPRAA